MALPLLPMMAPAALNAGLSIYQLIKAKQLGDKMDSEGRPIRQVPNALQDAYSRVAGLATQRQLPGQSIIENKIRNSTASASNALSQIASGGEALGSLENLYSSEQNKIADLGVAGEQEWLKKQGLLTDIQGKVASEEDLNFNYNQAAPWDNKMLERSMLLSGGLQNLSGGINSASNAFINKYSTDDNWAAGVNDWVSNLFGRRK